MTNSQKKRGKNKIAEKHQFVGLIIVCVAILVFSSATIFMKNDDNRIATLKSLTFHEEAVKNGYDVLIDEESTLLQISQANEMPLEKLYEVLNIDGNVDPKTKICELFDRCE